MSLDGRTILIVEDDYLIGKTLAELLANEGATVVGPLGWVDEAVAVAKDTRKVFDTAILDVNLHGVLSYPVADALLARDVRVIFATGYGPGPQGQSYRGCAHCTKPFDRSTLLSALLAPREEGC
jgi:DNA-binding response OmpR family regulator